MPKKKKFDVDKASELTPASQPENITVSSGELPLESPQPVPTRLKRSIETRDTNLNTERIASLPPALRSFLTLVQQSDFYSENRLEPIIGSEEGDAFLEQDNDIIACLTPQSFDKSIFILLVEGSTNRCRLCGLEKGSPARTLTCIRSHLDHRPFRCPGVKGGCQRCSESRGYARFFSQSLLRDHITSQTQKFQCVHEGCSSTLRRGGMRRHWKTMHKDTPFPAHLYPGYHQRDEA